MVGGRTQVTLILMTRTFLHEGGRSVEITHMKSQYLSTADYSLVLQMLQLKRKQTKLTKCSLA